MPAIEKRGTNRTPLVAASGQGWKTSLGLAGVALAAVASVYQLIGPAHVRTAAIVVAVVSGLVGIAAFLAVRCPSCGRSLGVWSFRTGSLTTWHEKLAEVAECPYCGHGGAGARPRR